ncbi:hypothetical protein JCM11491_004128 [Sporobolomyces phaffii]
MPLFKQVTAAQRRSKRKAEALLSDEEGNDSSSDEDRLDSDASASDDSGSDEDEDEDEDEDDEVLGSASEDDDEEPEVLDEDEPRPPPVGFPTAHEALENTVASTAALIAEMDAEKGDDAAASGGEDDEEAPLVCVVCPNKILKPGKMVEVHLASKDHNRRFNRFKVHVDSPEFVAEHRDADARWVASQLDKAVLARLSAQTQLGGKKAAAAAAAETKPTPSTSASVADAEQGAVDSESAAPAKAAPRASKNDKKERVAQEAAASGVSVREQMRQKWKAEKKDRAKKRKLAKKEKFDERKRAKVEKGEKPEPFISSKPRFVEKIKPTAEEIEIRQRWKAERNAAKAKGLPPPPKPVLAYELGGKVPVVTNKSKQGKAATTPKKKQKQEVVDGSSPAATKAEGKGKGDEQKKKKKEKSTGAKTPKGDAVLPEV